MKIIIGIIILFTIAITSAYIAHKAESYSNLELLMGMLSGASFMLFFASLLTYISL